jgi:hypothetical protein
MDRHRMSAITETASALRFSDGLMMAMLAAKPVRRKNLFGTRIDVNLKRLSSAAYEWHFESHETKTKERISALLPGKPPHTSSIGSR